MDWKTIAATVLIVVGAAILLALIGGVFAYDRGVYVTMQGMTVNDGIGSTAVGSVMSVYVDRGLGRDRRLFMSANPQSAWSFYNSWKNRNQMTLRYVQPGG